MTPYPLIRLLANAFAATFSILCVMALVVIAFIALGTLGVSPPFAMLWMILGFIMLALLVG